MAAAPCVLTESDVVVATVVFLEWPCDDDATARSGIARFGGRVWVSTPERVLATFDAPSRAIRCAQSLRSSGVAVRAGMHAGQVEVHPDGIAGVAVQVAATILEATPQGGVLVSRTVAELVAGSGIDLVDRGEHGALHLFCA